tara:strand:- start:21408 stop:26768 length:5361 start_codon:yes stop_codon:yes gene_type:complete
LTKINRAISKYSLALLLITIAFISNAQEICDNGIDDDGDGLIDCFDGDCSGVTDCSTFYFGKDSGDCQIAPPVVAGYNLVEKWRSVVDVETRGTPIVGDLDGDGIPEVVTHFRDDNTVYILDGATGATKYTINAHLSEYSQSPAIADVDNDGFGEVFLVDHFGKLRCFDHQGNPKVGFNEITISKGQGTFQGVYAGNPSFADFNGDGISEIFIGNQIFNSITGLVTAELPNLYNESKGAIGVNGHMYSAAFDILPDNFCADCSGMELICGNVVYSVNITTGVLTEVSKAPNSVNDGKVSLADWDGDNKMDIIVSGTCCGDGGVIYIWNPRTQAFVTHDAQGNPLQENPFDVQPDQNTQVGLASIADFDGDGFLEIGMAGRNEFITIESNMTRKWAIPVVDQSNMTTSTAFDFEGDGKTEVVYRDENFLYILDGATGAIITKRQCGSGTRTELPIVVDVNGDGDAELVCTCSDVNGGGKGQVRVYESDSTIWVPTRKVWNTHNYVPTFINDDLSVPKEFQNKALIDGQDLYLAQTSLTYKSGNPVYPVLPDYTIALDSIVTNCNLNTGLAHVKVCQVNTDALVFDFDISFYKGDPLTGGTLIGTKRIDNSASTIPSTGCMVTTHVVNAENYDLHVYVNDQGTSPSNSPIILMPECDTTNNLATYSVSACNKGCETPITGSVDSKIAAWQYIGEVTKGLNYELEAISGSNSFIATDGPDAGKDIFAVVFNTSHGGQVSLNRTRYYSNDTYRDVLTGTYDNSPHVWTGLNGGEKAPVLGYIAFIDLDGNGNYNSGTDIYYRDINSLSFDALSNGDLYMAFYDDGTYSDNASKITVSSTATNCPTDLAISKTDGREDYTPGTTTEYIIVVKNHGPYDALDVVIDDPLPTGISNGDVSWDATVSGGAVSGVIGSQAGALNDIADIPVGDSIIYSVNIAIPTDYKGDLINTVTIFSELDSNPVNDIASDIDFNGLCVGATISSFAEQFNTGVKTNPGENDPNWKIQWINDPVYHVYPANSYATPTSNAVIPAVGMNKAAGVWGDAFYPDYLWVCYPWVGINNGPGKHIDVDRDGIGQEYSGGTAISGTGDAVLLKFSKTFEMTSSQVEASEISFGIAADNTIEDIIVNGVSQGPKYLGSYQLVPHTLVQDFKVGTNIVEIIVNSGPGYAGMMIANSTIKAVDSVSLIITDPPVGCAPVVVDITDSLWTVGSVNAPDLIYFEDSAALIPYTTPETADSGVYYIVGINEVGCSDTAKINIGQNPTPDVELSDTAFCDGKEAILDAGVFDAWEWNVGSEIGQTITVDETDEYKVVVSNIYNCLDSDSVLVTVHELPEVIVNDTIICIGDTIQIPAISTTATEYLWMQNGAGINQTSKGAKEGAYEVIITDLNGCKDTTDAELTHHISPTVTVNNDTICIGEPDGEFSAISTTAISYVWSENARGVLATTSGSKAGDYTVIVEDVNRCKDTATGVLHVDTLPIVFVADTVICSNVPSVDISAESTTAKFYEWGGTGIGSTKTISAIDAGNYTVIVTDENGCKQQTNANLYRVDQPELFEIEGDSLACEGGEIELLINVTADKIEWSTGEEGQNITTTETGEYNVITTNEGYGITCSEGNSKEVEFLPFPILPAEEEFINCFDYLDVITIKISSPAYIVWNESESDRPDSSLVITQEGIYNATLYHYPMCPIEVEREVIEFCPMTFFVPNVFTPNGDGLNDTFEPKMSNIESYKIMIFNRWGDLIFTSYDPSNQWDGTVNSNEVQIDVYVYKIVVKGFSQIGDLDLKELVGTVTILK